ncbi:hypothetical protein Anapl_09671 [Anas platyrhynchos]|uniref:Uncharacterized protein n=1 Tax=Anas platyrhynchos TaxID=8839 RepID=R0L3D1_ANAPL|nr:hypothetical protein Anapl_09671 [Anas platyrhynchos]
MAEDTRALHAAFKAFHKHYKSIIHSIVERQCNHREKAYERAYAALQPSTSFKRETPADFKRLQIQPMPRRKAPASLREQRMPSAERPQPRACPQPEAGGNKVIVSDKAASRGSRLLSVRALNPRHILKPPLRN